MRALALGAAMVAAATVAMPAGPASADAYAYVPPGAAMAGYDWTGIYVGGQIGAAHSSTKWFFNGTLDDIENTDTAFAGGAFVGLQKHWRNMVFGAEVAYTWSDLEGSKLSATVPSVTLASEVRNLLLVTGKFGYTWDYILAYAKAGYATGDVDFRTSAAGVVTTSSSDRESGWTAALGLEFALRPNIILGVEYDYVRLNVSGRDHTAAPAGFPGGQIGDAGVDIQTVMARLSYKFGPRVEPIPGPIK
jgi:outer membrane immunogenic protein